MASKGVIGVAHRLRILGPSGDTAVAWDVDNEAAVAEAERVFNEHRAKGYQSYQIDTPSLPGERIEKFNPEANEILLFGQVVGG